MPTGVYDRATCARTSWKHTDATKEKLRLSSSGKKHSDETKRKMSLAHLGRKKTDEDRRGISQRMIGNRHGLGSHSLEARQKMRASARRGPDSNFWKGGTTEQAKLIRQSAEYRLWRQAVFERDSYTCQMCGQRGGRLHPDHIKRFSAFPELRFDVNNGRTLCEPCHKQTPTYGRRKACQSI